MKYKKILGLGAILVAITATTMTAFAYNNQSGPMSGFMNARGDSESFEEHRQDMLDWKKEKLDIAVSEGVLTQAESEKILDQMQTNMDSCGGENRGMMGNGSGRGMMNGDSHGRGMMGGYSSSRNKK